MISKVRRPSSRKENVRQDLWNQQSRNHTDAETMHLSWQKLQVSRAIHLIQLNKSNTKILSKWQLAICSHNRVPGGFGNRGFKYG